MLRAPGISERLQDEFDKKPAAPGGQEGDSTPDIWPEGCGLATGSVPAAGAVDRS